MSNNKTSNNIMQFIKRITTVHGISHFNYKRGRDLSAWCAVLLANVLLTAAFIIVIKNKFKDGQIVTQINSNCKINQVPFPAVSICNINTVSLKESFIIQQMLKTHNIPSQEIQNFLKMLPILKDYNKNSVDAGNYTHIMNILRAHYYTMDSIMQELHQKCENLLVYCTFNRKVKSCENIFKLTKTLEGYCCTFNYVGVNDASEVVLRPPDEDFEYYDDQNNDDDTLGGKIIVNSESGSNSGLNVIVNLEPEDYPPWSKLPYYGAKVLLSDPNDFPEESIVYHYLTLAESLDIKAEASLFQSEESIRYVEPDKRGCWFYDEVNLEHTDRYSYETCKTECRMKFYRDNCGCTPYKYPRPAEHSIKLCELEDLKCLHNLTVHISTKDMQCTPVCYIECRDKKYSATTDSVPFLGVGIPTSVIENYNISHLAELQVYYAKSNINCYKLTLLIDLNYFIATYGGVFSLSFGSSIITIFELVFIITTLCIEAITKRVLKSFYYNN